MSVVNFYVERVSEILSEDEAYRSLSSDYIVVLIIPGTGKKILAVLNEAVTVNIGRVKN